MSSFAQESREELYAYSSSAFPSCDPEPQSCTTKGSALFSVCLQIFFRSEIRFFCVKSAVLRLSFFLTCFHDVPSYFERISEDACFCFPRGPLIFVSPFVPSALPAPDSSILFTFSRPPPPPMHASPPPHSIFPAAGHRTVLFVWSTLLPTTRKTIRPASFILITHAAHPQPHKTHHHNTYRTWRRTVLPVFFGVSFLFPFSDHLTRVSLVQSFFL